MSHSLRITNTMNGVIYCRVSSKEQIEGTSLESQEAACRDYAKTKNITVLRVFIEQGESAKFADRTQLVELIDFCRTKKGDVQLLIVWKVDRFARNVADHFSVKATPGLTSRCGTLRTGRRFRDSGGWFGVSGETGLPRSSGHSAVTVSSARFRH